MWTLVNQEPGNEEQTYTSNEKTKKENETSNWSYLWSYTNPISSNKVNISRIKLTYWEMVCFLTTFYLTVKQKQLRLKFLNFIGL